MEPVLNPLLFDLPEPPDPSESAAIEKPRKSRAAEYIAALYIALLVCTPWLVRDASFFRPQSTGIELHWSAVVPLQADASQRTAAVR